MTSNFDVSIVIPTWNGEHLLQKNLPSVFSAQQYKGNNIKEIIIVDDGSTDDTVKFLKKNYGRQIRLIKHTKNRGFSAAVNTGVRMAKYPLICLLNNDVIPSKKFLVSPIKQFNDASVFAVCFHEEGNGPALAYFKDGYWGHKAGSESKNIEISAWANGGSSLVSREKYMELKGLDEVLFTPFYWEDIDLSFRAAKRGYKILWDPKAYVQHKHETTINTDNFRKKYMDRIKERNQLLFIWKNITSPRLTRQHINGVIARTLRHPGYMRIVWSALKKRKDAVKARKIEIKESKVSDEAIFAKLSKS